MDKKLKAILDAYIAKNTRTIVPPSDPVIIPSGKDYSQDFGRLAALLSLLHDSILTLTGLLAPRTNQDEIEKIKKEIGDLKKRGGGSMYQAWMTDTTYDGTLSGAVNGVNQTFTLRGYPKANALILIWNGPVQTITSDFTISGKTITTNFIPQSGDTLTGIYPV